MSGWQGEMEIRQKEGVRWRGMWWGEGEGGGEMWLGEREGRERGELWWGGEGVERRDVVGEERGGEKCKNVLDSRRCRETGTRRPSASLMRFMMRSEELRSVGD